MTKTATDVWPTRHLFGIPVHALSMNEVLGIVAETIRARGRLLLGVVNAAKMVNMHRDPILRDSVLTADMILADGMAVVWACRLLGRKLPERVPGIDLMERLLEVGSEQHYRVYCLGASEEVLEKTLEQMRARFPGVQFVGHHHGYFNSQQEPEIVQEIRAARPDILFVAMTSPKKEQFLAQWAEEMDVPICHGVGGAFDVLAGKVRRAPMMWQRLGLEWLYRVVQEPRRMWRRYLVTNTLFCGMVLSEMMGRRRWVRT